MASTANQSSKLHLCEYCNKSFAKEKTLVAHMCESKRRWLQKDDKAVVLGFWAFQRFYKLSAGSKTEKTYQNFCESSFYNAFVKFGTYLKNIQPLYTEKYIDHVVTSGIKLDHWCRDDLYEAYVLDLILKEDVQTALERSITTMIQWGEENRPSPWNHYFKYVNPNRAVWDIKDGKISPWLILNCKTGQDMLKRFSDEQLMMIANTCDPKHWALQFKRKVADVELVKKVAKESNL